MWQVLFQNTNNFGNRALYNKASLRTSTPIQHIVGGTCAAQVALWLKRLYFGAERGRPDQFRAMLIYGKWRNWHEAHKHHSDYTNIRVIKSVGFSVAEVFRFSPEQAMRFIGSFPGYYYISTGNHAMGLATKATGAYFFDPVVGACKSPNQHDIVELKPNILHYSGFPLYNPLWEVFRVINDGAMISDEPDNYD